MIIIEFLDLSPGILPSFNQNGYGQSIVKCRFQDEIDGLEIFQSYSQAACEFEYKIRKSIEFCRCAPWYIPINSNNRYAICDIDGIFCFNTVMRLHKSNATIHCFPTCHQVRFTSNQYIEKLDAETICDDFSSIESYIALKTSGYDNGRDLLFTTRKLQDILMHDVLDIYPTNRSIDLMSMKKKYCKNLVNQDLARITVVYESKKYLRTRTNKRVTFAERLGAFGNIYY